ncbi:MAG: NEW3 domain-containing protein [Lachnospiraceae bacterium]|nr:NEW3 domain-containing protein [Lachnospiraceae bacterium]
MKKRIFSMTAAIMLLFLTAVAPLTSMTASAASGFELYTTYPGISVEAGETQSITMYVENNTGSNVDASLSIASMPDDWTCYFTGDSTTVSQIHVQDGTEESFTFYAVVPEDTTEGTYTIEVQAVTDTGVSDTQTLSLTVEEIEYGQSSLDVDYPEQEGASGTSFSFDATITNNSAEDLTYSLSAKTSDGWQVSFTPSSESTQVASIEVAAGSSEGITISVTPPANVEAGTFTIPITAASSVDTLSEDLSITITGTYSLTLSTSSGLLSFDAHVNKESDVTLTVTNNSNVDLENINLTSSAPSDWTVSFETSTIETLEAGATVEVTMHVTPSDSAMTGDYVTTITASCSEASDSAEFRVSVKTQTIWGIVAVLLIIALLLGVSMIFDKYGRR